MGLPLLPYVILCLIAGLLARETRIGFLATFLVAFLLTPIPVFLGLYCFVPAPTPEPAAPAPEPAAKPGAE